LPEEIIQSIKHYRR